MRICNIPCFFVLCLITLSTACGSSKEEIRLAQETKAKGIENAKLLQESQSTKAENAKLLQESQSTKAENVQLAEQVKGVKMALSEAKVRADKLEESLLGIAKAKKQEETEQANKSKLTIQAGVTMKSGDTKPVTNTKIFITKKSLDEFYKLEKPTEYERAAADIYKATGGHALWVLAVQFPRVRAPDFKEHSIASTQTDFNGVAEIPDLMPGIYYIHCGTSLGGAVVWSFRIEVKAGQNKIFLSNDNVTGNVSTGL